MSGIKSAYELAQERLAKQNPAAAYKLTAGQKKQLAEVDCIYEAKIAQREMALQEQTRAAVFAGEEEKAQKLREQWTAELHKLRDEKEAKKEKIRAAQSR